MQSVPLSATHDAHPVTTACHHPRHEPGSAVPVLEMHVKTFHNGTRCNHQPGEIYLWQKKDKGLQPLAKLRITPESLSKKGTGPTKLFVAVGAGDFVGGETDVA